MCLKLLAYAKHPCGDDDCPDDDEKHLAAAHAVQEELWEKKCIRLWNCIYENVSPLCCPIRERELDEKGDRTRHERRHGGELRKRGRGISVF